MTTPTADTTVTDDAPQAGPANTPDPAPKPTPPATPVPTPPPAKPEPPRTPSPPAVDSDTRSLDDLPSWVKEELGRARGDAAKYRTRARDSVTEAETLTARVAELETARRAAEANAIAARHQISDEDADLFFPPNATRDQLEKIAEALGQRRTGAVIPREGTGAAAKPGADPLAVFAKSLFTSD